MNKSIYIKDYYVLPPTKQLSDLLSFGLNIVPELSYNFYELNSLRVFSVSCIHKFSSMRGALSSE